MRLTGTWDGCWLSKRRWLSTTSDALLMARTLATRVMGTKVKSVFYCQRYSVTLRGKIAGLETLQQVSLFYSRRLIW
jgi:hypothetical protein